MTRPIEWYDVAGPRQPARFKLSCELRDNIPSTRRCRFFERSYESRFDVDSSQSEAVFSRDDAFGSLSIGDDFVLLLVGFESLALRCNAAWNQALSL